MILINKIYWLAAGATALSSSSALVSYLSKAPEIVKDITQEQLPEPKKIVNTVEHGRAYVKEKYKKDETVKGDKWNTTYKDLNFGVIIE